MEKDTTETFAKKLKERFQNIEMVSEYGKDNDDKIIVRCIKHDHTWQTTPHHLMASKHACKYCYREYRIELDRKKNSEKFNLFLEEHYAPFYEVSEVNYVNNKTKVKLICPEHGPFFLKPEKMMCRLDGCPYCRESHLERSTRGILDALGIRYSRQQHFNWLGLLSLDFYLPDYNVAIECQGEQHFKQREDSLFSKHDPFDDRLDRDMTKNERCKENGVKLIYLLNKKFKKLSEGELFKRIYSKALLIEDIEKNHSILLDYIKNAELILTD